jgi:5-formyltetrahydrofolate cyclo-ligase
MSAVQETSPVVAQKVALRRRMRAMLVPRDAAAAEAAAASFASLLEAQPCWQQAGSILAFLPMPEELDVRRVLLRALQEGRRVVLPRYRPASRDYEVCTVTNFAEDLQTGAFGILEPAAHRPVFPLASLEFVLVPGLAFDEAGRRLGRGKGFFDRLLAGVRGVTCGVGFDTQIVAEVPVESHDRPVTCLATPTRWIRCQQPPL